MAIIIRRATGRGAGGSHSGLESHAFQELPGSGKHSERLKHLLKHVSALAGQPNCLHSVCPAVCKWLVVGSFLETETGSNVPFLGTFPTCSFIFSFFFHQSLKMFQFFSAFQH